MGADADEPVGKRSKMGAPKTVATTLEMDRAGDVAANQWARGDSKKTGHQQLDEALEIAGCICTEAQLKALYDRVQRKRMEVLKEAGPNTKSTITRAANKSSK